MDIGGARTCGGYGRISAGHFKCRVERSAGFVIFEVDTAVVGTGGYSKTASRAGLEHGLIACVSDDDKAGRAGGWRRQCVVRSTVAGVNRVAGGRLQVRRCDVDFWTAIYCHYVLRSRGGQRYVVGGARTGGEIKLVSRLIQIDGSRAGYVDVTGSREVDDFAAAAFGVRYVTRRCCFTEVNIAAKRLDIDCAVAERLRNRTALEIERQSSCACRGLQIQGISR